MAVAALGYLQISIVAWCGEMAHTVARCHLSLAKVCEELLVVELTVELIHLGNFLLQLALVSL